MWKYELRIVCETVLFRLEAAFGHCPEDVERFQMRFVDRGASSASRCFTRSIISVSRLFDAFEVALQALFVGAGGSALAVGSDGVAQVGRELCEPGGIFQIAFLDRAIFLF